ncbi:MAG: CpsD/CapB family tyrosine-protein kinase [Planctomycetes bacterium]|nr:CpsD/CapB family tyrosine-protein kinase [Planctomycetota bacterium]
MGRIADALKRAEQERSVSVAESIGHIGMQTAEPVGIASVTVPHPPPTDDEANEPEPRVAVVGGLSESLIPFFEPSSLVTEQYRSLRTRLLSQNPNYEHKVIAITSAVPKEGKSVTTLNLGCVLAEIRHLKILVVDGDFRRSSLARMLDQNDGPGLADVLSGDAKYEDVIRDTPIKNLKFISAGRTRHRSAAELLTAATASPSFRRMRNEFHYTFVDTPPATTVTDVGIIGQMCSGVIVIVRLHRTHDGAARRAVRLLQVNNIPIIGCMVVGRDSPADRYGYGNGYYYYNYYRYNDYIKKPGGKRK